MITHWLLENLCEKKSSVKNLWDLGVSVHSRILDMKKTISHAIGIALIVIVLYIILKVSNHDTNIHIRTQNYVHTFYEQLQFGEYSIVAIGIFYVLFCHSNIFNEEEEEVNKTRARNTKHKTISNIATKKGHNVTSITRERKEGKCSGDREDPKRARRRRKKIQEEKQSRKKLLIQRHRTAMAKRNYEKLLFSSRSPGITGIVMEQRSKIYTT